MWTKYFYFIFSPLRVASFMITLTRSLKLWEDSSCTGIPQCMLNRSILAIAAKYLEPNIINCLNQFLILAKKANTWSAEHLLSRLDLAQKHQEEHSAQFFGIVFGSLSMSYIIVTALTNRPVLGETNIMIIIEDFVLELLKVAKVSLLEIKKIQSLNQDILESAHGVLDVVVKLCRAYLLAIKCDSSEKDMDRENDAKSEKSVDYVSHVANLTSCTVDHLYELGIYAASGGGSLVMLLNLSWKGVVSLLQLGKGVLGGKINVTNIIIHLVTIGSESLRCATESWSSSVHETLASNEVKRTLLPIKFYLINALRICSEYPSEAIEAHREVTRCVLIISSLVISLSKESKYRMASEAIVEQLEPTTFLLFNTLLSSEHLQPEVQHLLLERLFYYEKEHSLSNEKKNVDAARKFVLFDNLFSTDCDATYSSESFVTGRVVCFLNLLKSSPVLREEVVVGLSRKLGFLLHTIVHEDVYPLVLGLHVPVFNSSGPNPAMSWQPLLSLMLQALKTFMIVASASSAWLDMETFLFQNLLHCHPLCFEILTELWCFFVRHAESNMVLHILDQFYSILKLIAASSEPALEPSSAVRRISRQVCSILSFADSTSVDQFYISIINDKESCLSSTVFLSLLMEGFPLDLLSNESKKVAIQNIVTSFHACAESNIEELGLTSSADDCYSLSIELPVCVLSSSLNCSQVIDHISKSNNFSQIVKFALSLINGYKNASNHRKELDARLLGVILLILSNVKEFYGSADMERLIFELHVLFVDHSSNADRILNHCKPSLASFMAGICQAQLEESEGNRLSNAIWDLYHTLLRERHWAIVHLVISAFGHFATRTTCGQLWRFVPHDAALAFDTRTGSEASQEIFMSEVKAVIEKERAIPNIKDIEDERTMLALESSPLKKLLLSSSALVGNEENYGKKRKRKIPDGIAEGLKLLQSGLKVVSNALSQDNAAEFRDVFASHVSSLEDVLTHLTGLMDAS